MKKSWMALMRAMLARQPPAPRQSVQIAYGNGNVQAGGDIYCSTTRKEKLKKGRLK